FHFPARHGFPAGDSANAGRHSCGDGRDWEARRNERWDPRGTDYWRGRCVGREKTGGAQRETGARRGREIEENESDNQRLTRSLCGGGALPRRTGPSPVTTHSQLQSFQIFPELSAQIFAFQRKLHCGFEEAEFVASIVAAAFVDVGIQLLAL